MQEETINQTLYQELYIAIQEISEKIYINFTNTFNSMILIAGEEITRPVEEWNEGAFQIVERVADQVLLPIGAIFLLATLIFRLIHIFGDSNGFLITNNMQKAVLLGKFILLLYAWENSFDIMNGVLSIGLQAGSRISRIFRNDLVISAEEQFQNILPRTQDIYDWGILIDAVGILICLILAYVVVMIFAFTIYYTVIIWFIETLVYLASSPLALSFFPLDDTQDITKNYVKKIFAMGFRPFFIMLIFMIYGASLPIFLQGDSGLMILINVCAVSGVLYLLLQKTGTISNQIFNVTN